MLIVIIMVRSIMIGMMRSGVGVCKSMRISMIDWMMDRIRMGSRNGNRQEGEKKKTVDQEKGRGGDD